MKKIDVEQACMGDTPVFIASIGLDCPISAIGKTKRLAKSNLYERLDILYKQIGDILKEYHGK